MYTRGVRAFIASNKYFGDPKRGKVKTLIMTWRRYGKYIRKYVREHSGKIIHVPSGKISGGRKRVVHRKKAHFIKKAKYGGKDVTRIVRYMWKRGTRSFFASNKFFGDPKPNVVKYLHI